MERAGTCPPSNWVRHLVRPTDGPNTLITELEANCNPSCATASVSGCVNTVVGIGCLDLQEAVKGVPEIFVDRFCLDVEQAADYTNSSKAADDLGLLLDWYQGTFAPCVSQICSTSTSPVDANKLSQAPINLIKRLVENEIGKKDLFFLKYGFIIALILFGVIIVLVFALIFKR